MLAVAGMALLTLAVRKPAAPTAHKLPDDEMLKPAIPTALLSLPSCVVKSSCDVEAATKTLMELAKIIREVLIRAELTVGAARGRRRAANTARKEGQTRT